MQKINYERSQHNGDNIAGDKYVIENAFNETYINDIDINIKKKKIMGNFSQVYGTTKVISIGSFILFLLALSADLITIFNEIHLNNRFPDKLTFFGNLTLVNIAMFTLAFMIMLLVVLHLVKRKKVFPITYKLFKVYLYLGDDNILYKFKATGICEICGSNMKYSYNEEMDTFEFICKRNPSQHRFEHDFTQLSME